MQPLSLLLDELYALNRLGIKPGIETEQALLAELDHPEKNTAFIHVAGSNGKGSVCAIIESVLRHAGLKTGLFTSPHLISFNERIRFDGKPITDQDLKKMLPVIMSAGRDLAERTGQEATFFEIVTGLAFYYFAEKRPDIVILETGMGGRLDATNVVKPLLSVITDISIDHTAYLGTTVKAIAKEKCGIIKPGTPVVTGALPEEARAIALAAAASLQAPFIEAQSNTNVVRLSQTLHGQEMRIETASGLSCKAKTSLLGRHQLANTAIAVTAAECLFKNQLPPECCQNGLKEVFWPARLQVLEEKPPVILDGAHNAGGALACALSLKELLPHTPWGAVVGMADDKDLDGFMRVFRGLVKQFWAVPLRNPRGRTPGVIASSAESHGVPAVVSESPAVALQAAKAWAVKQNGAVCIAGSLFLAGEVLELYHRDGNLF